MVTCRLIHYMRVTGKKWPRLIRSGSSCQSRRNVLETGTLMIFCERDRKKFPALCGLPANWHCRDSVVGPLILDVAWAGSHVLSTIIFPNALAWIFQAACCRRRGRLSPSASFAKRATCILLLMGLLI